MPQDLRWALATIALLVSGTVPGLSHAKGAAGACALLGDPQRRPMMSAALELKLQVQCGSIEMPPPTAPRPPSAPSAPLPPGVDVLVNDPAADTDPRSTQSETSMVVVGNTICAGFNDSGEFMAGNGFSGYAYSLDGGATWTDGGSFPAGPGDDDSFGDPSLAYSLRDDAIYYASLSDVGLSLWVSNDSCQTFTYVGPISSSSGDDKELMAIDNDVFSPYYGRIYVGWTDFDRITDFNVVSFSDDGGATWSPRAVLAGSGTSGQGMWPAIAPNGDVYFALLNRGSLGGTQDQWIYRSTNGGVSFVQRTDIATNQAVPGDAASTASCSRLALNSEVRNLPSPQIVIDEYTGAAAGYRIYAIYPYDSDGAGADESNVFVRFSDDGALTWSAETQINDDATTRDQFFPAIAVDDATTDLDPVAASWYDRRLSATNTDFDRYMSTSEDGGVTWYANRRVSDVSSPVATTNPNFDPAVNDCYHGDYDELVMDGTNVYVLWSDDRRIVGHGPDPDIYFDIVPYVGDHPCCDTGTPGCDDAEIQNQVCEADAFCCDTSWDALCVQQVTTVARQSCRACVERGTRSTSDVAIRDCVCAMDTFCCDARWDGVCVRRVEDFGCGSCAEQRFVYVNNNNDDPDNSVSGFAVEEADGFIPEGFLTATWASPYATGDAGGTFAAHVDAIAASSVPGDPMAGCVFATNTDAGTVTSFRRFDFGGELILAGPNQAAGSSPVPIEVDSARSLVYVGNFDSHDISVFSYGTTCVLTPIGTYPAAPALSPLDIEVSLDGRKLFVSQDFSSNVSVFDIGAGGSSLTHIAGSPFSAGGIEHGLTRSPDESLLYVGNLSGNTISGFDVAGNGALSSVPGSPFTTGVEPVDGLVSIDGDYLIFSNNDPNLLEVFQIQVDGSLASLGTTATDSPSPDQGPAGLVMDLTRNLYNVNGGFDFPQVGTSASVSVYDFSLAGNLTGVTGSPFETGVESRPSGIVFVPEPGEMHMLVAGCAALLGLRRLRRARRVA